MGVVYFAKDSLIDSPKLWLSWAKLKKGNIITKLGEVYEVINPDFETDIKNELKAVFDVGRSF